MRLSRAERSIKRPVLSPRPQMWGGGEGETFYPPLISLVSGLCASLLAIINIPLICKVSHEFSSTLINKLIFSDCLIALLNIPLILHGGNTIKLSCTFITFVDKFVWREVIPLTVGSTDTSCPASTGCSQWG